MSHVTAVTKRMSVSVSTEEEASDESSLVKVSLGDQVLCPEYGKGIVSFFGPTDWDRDRILVGLSLEKRKGNNDGSVRHRKYFKCKPSHGIFVLREQISKVVIETENERVCYGDVIEVPDRGKGKVMFAGFTEFAKGIWYGLQLESKKGKNDGRIDSVRYFRCEKKKGLMVKESHLLDFAAATRRSSGSSSAEPDSSSAFKSKRSPPLEAYSSLDSEGSSARYGAGSAAASPVPGRPDDDSDELMDDEEQASGAGSRSASVTRSSRDPRFLALSDTEAAEVETDIETSPVPPPPDFSSELPPPTSPPKLGTTFTTEIHPTPTGSVEEIDDEEAIDFSAADWGKGGKSEKKSHTLGSTSSPPLISTPPLTVISKSDLSKGKTGPLTPAKRITVGIPRSMSCADVEDAKKSRRSRRGKKPLMSPVGDSTGGDQTPGAERVTTLPTMIVHTSDSEKIHSRAKLRHDFKIVVIGGSRVGKTSLIRRFVYNTWGRKYKRSVEHREYLHSVTVPIELKEEFTEDLNMNALLGSRVSEIYGASPSGSSLVDGPVIKKLEVGSTPVITEEERRDSDDEESDNPFEQLESSVSSESDIFADAEVIGPGAGMSGGGATHSSAFSSPPPAVSLGANLMIPRVQIKTLNLEIQVNLKILDMGFHVSDPSVFEDVSVVILVCDLTDPDSLSEALTKYQHFLARLPELKKRYRSSSTPTAKGKRQNDFIPVVVAGNKCQSPKKKVLKPELHKFVRDYIQREFDSSLDVLGVSSPKFELPVVRDGDVAFEPKTIAQGTAAETVIDVPWQGKMRGIPKSRMRPKHKVVNETLVLPPTVKVVTQMSPKGSEDDDDDLLDELAAASGEDSDLDDEESERRRKSSKGKFPPSLKTSDLRSGSSSSSSSSSSAADAASKMEESPDDAGEYSVSVVECDAKSSYNVVKVFEKCIHKVLPNKLVDFGHTRKDTTVQLAAPIWLRQMYLDVFDLGSEDETATSMEDEISAMDDQPSEWLDSDGRQESKSSLKGDP